MSSATYALRSSGHRQVKVLVTSLFLLGWWVAVMYAWLPTSAPQDLGAALTATEEGSLLNVALIVSLALVGVWYLRDGYQALLAPHNRIVAAAFGLYLLWSLASFAWSANPNLSVRRFAQLFLLVVASAGIGAGFYGAQRDGLLLLMRHVLVAAVIAQVTLWASLLQSGNVDLLDPTWSVKEVIGSPVGFPTAFAVVAAVHLLRRETSPGLRALLFVFLGASAVTLFAQKMRMVVASVSLLVVLAIGRSLSVRKAIIAALVSALVLTMVAELAVLLGDVYASVRDTAWSYVTLDASAGDLESLTGRVPLWEALVDTAQQRPWLGYGYGAFWDTENIDRLFREIGWEAVTAHNGFLDEVLATGAIGLIACLVAWLACILRAWQLKRGGVDPYAGVVLEWLILFLCFNTAGSIMQFYFQFPFYVSLAGLAALMRLASRPRTGEAGAAEL